jgi:alpha-methylacyl-CoA racemase
MAGALDGITVIELAGIGPVPFAGMMLGDHGAKVIRIERPGQVTRLGDFGYRDILARNREIMVIDLKSPAGVAQVRELLRGFARKCSNGLAWSPMNCWPKIPAWLSAG